MDQTDDLSSTRLAGAWAELHAHAQQGNPLEADAYRLAFADPEFLLRRETRGVRMQLEMLKPEISQDEQGIENTVVVFGSARFSDPEQADAALAAAEANLAAQPADSAAQDALTVARRKVRTAR